MSCYSCRCRCSSSTTTSTTCNCTLVGINGTTASMTDPTTWQIDSPHPPHVKSTDGSITITQTTEIVSGTETREEYDLSATSADTKVGGCSGDLNPSTLDNKLEVGNYLTKSISDCPNDAKVTLDVDMTAVLADVATGTDTKVAINAGCDAGYLEDVLTAGTGLTITQASCDMQISLNDDQFRRPFAKIYMSSDQSITMAGGTGASGLVDGGWFVVQTTQGDNNNGNSIATWVDVIDVNVDTEYGFTRSYGVIKAIEVQKEGRYQVSVDGAIDINYGVKAFRILAGSTDSGHEVIIDSKYGAPRLFALNDQATNDANPANHNPGDGSVADDWFKQYDIGGTKTVYLQAGTRILGIGRMDNAVTTGNGSGQDGHLVVRSAGLSGGLLGSGSTLDTKAGFNVSVTRISDQNGDVRF